MSILLRPTFCVASLRRIFYGLRDLLTSAQGQTPPGEPQPSCPAHAEFVICDCTIEVLFKRIKQLLCQHILRAETEETARATVYAILVSWVLQHEVALELRANLQEMYLILEEEGKTMIEDPTNQERQEEPAISEWQVQALSVNLFRQQVQGVWSRQRLLDCLPLLRRHLGERRRKRPHQWQQVHRWLV